MSVAPWQIDHQHRLAAGSEHLPSISDLPSDERAIYRMQIPEGTGVDSC
jgi:hypothetical protein